MIRLKFRMPRDGKMFSDKAASMNAFDVSYKYAIRVLLRNYFFVTNLL